MKNTFKEITVSFCLSLTILGGFLILMLTHFRIQNTISPNDYTLLEIYRISENQLEVLFDNNNFLIDLTNINNLWEKLQSFEIFIPPSIKIITTTLNSTIDYFLEISINILNK